ncbi:ABC transporter ATP-binding protein [Corynebacterium sp. HMSC078H07]|uniref:ABC transporter ATP-binding protein n=1 Tax=Corynebacterium sp. HMSC078H07 TaxID=1739379 RepID=UPI0008A36C6C|nr:ABC transporter ATP-binding protein [Corynebacterium sp. HMSC078H07]
MNSSHVELKNITKQYGSKTVLDNLNLEIGKAELVALLGPSGCGKSTTLKILAGLEHADQGSVCIDGNEISYLPTRRRNMGIVFQAYSLFPHLDAIDNVAYGLKIKGRSKRERRNRAGELLELVGLSEHTTKFPGQMSGGQQQRVALARALAIEPQLLLLDEPLSALDAKVRTQLRDEIRRIQLSEGISTLLVTHDQEEALVMADRIGVMNNGVIEQIGSPSELYHHPRSPFISQFVGVVNRICGEYNAGSVDVLGTRVDVANTEIDARDGDTLACLIRPEDLRVLPDAKGSYRILNKQLRGIFTSVMLAGPGSTVIRVDMSDREASKLPTGSQVSLETLRHDAVVDFASPDEVAEAKAFVKERNANA